MEKTSKTFKYGDLVIKCHQCDNMQVVEELVTDGRAIYIFNKEDSNFLKLHCPECNITMEMVIQPNEKANNEIKDEIEEATIVDTNEELPRENITEEAV